MPLYRKCETREIVNCREKEDVEVYQGGYEKKCPSTKGPSSKKKRNEMLLYRKCETPRNCGLQREKKLRLKQGRYEKSNQKVIDSSCPRKAYREYRRASMRICRSHRLGRSRTARNLLCSGRDLQFSTRIVMPDLPILGRLPRQPS
ncbi:hypothetical protein SISSUDRAFT_526970 [Sistotremastrum suecicum HHB10207 ss-3]|uniref:Uncharacterized protein n=1 Tax=Sistotremastrum suecicum HHB10207 ss-3 TaxID=1314776 RepID=A0A165XVI7_9AGAM|nr:hypothetical protein SISSUDRAFT_526970 [Sistotremastrum suecicum HHB10207 ss-3]